MVSDIVNAKKQMEDTLLPEQDDAVTAKNYGGIWYHATVGSGVKNGEEKVEGK